MVKKNNTEILKECFSFPDMFGFYLYRNIEKERLDLAVVQESTKGEKVAFLVVEQSGYDSSLKEMDKIDFSFKGKYAQFDCKDEIELYERIELAKSCYLD